MTREEITSGIKDVLMMVKPKLDLTTVEETSSLVTDLGIDSLSMLLLSLGIESKFNIRFTEQKPFQTVAEVIDYIERVV